MSNNQTVNAGEDLNRIHKVITRALKVSLQNCKPSELTENSRQGFLSYVKVLTILLHAHHEGEDEIAFPFWKSKFPAGPFDKLGEQHSQMISYLDQIEDWLNKNTKAWQDESLPQLHSVLSGLQNHWHTHIDLEEEVMSPGNSDKYLTPEENDWITKQMAEHGQAHATPPNIVMPFVVYNLEEADRKEFIRLLPPVMMTQLIPAAWKSDWEPMIPFLIM